MSSTRRGPTPLTGDSDLSPPVAVARWRRRPFWLLLGVLVLCIWGISDDVGNARDDRAAFAGAPAVEARVTDLQPRDDRVQLEYTDPSTNEQVHASVYVFDDDRFPAPGASTVDIEVGSTADRPARLLGDEFRWTQNLLMYPAYSSIAAVWLITRRRWVRSTRRIIRRHRAGGAVARDGGQTDGTTHVTMLQCRVAQLGVRGRWHLVAVTDADSRSALAVIPLIGTPDFPIDPLVEVGVAGKIGRRRRFTPVRLPPGQSPWWPAGRTLLRANSRQVRNMIELLASADGDIDDECDLDDFDGWQPLAETIPVTTWSKLLMRTGIGLMVAGPLTMAFGTQVFAAAPVLGAACSIVGLVVIGLHEHRDGFVSMSEGGRSAHGSRSVGTFRFEVERLWFGRRSVLPGRGQIRFEPTGLVAVRRGSERLLPWDSFEAADPAGWHVDVSADRDPRLTVTWLTSAEPGRFVQHLSITCGNSLRPGFERIRSHSAARLISSLAHSPEQRERLDDELDVRLLLCSLYARRSLAGDELVWSNLDGIVPAKFWNG